MSKGITMSTQTRTNWLIDGALFVSALVAALSGVYFLFVPTGGYQGGRNPWYGVTLLFSRQTWSDMHTWGGVLMIAAAVVHFAMHWGWVKMMSRRIFNAILSRGSRLSRGARFNVLIDVTIALSFLVTAVSGVYLLFAPAGGLQGGRNADWDPGVLFSRTTWDLLHTWAGVILIVAAVVHFWIHWRWVKNVTKLFFLSLWQRPAREEVSAVR